MMSRPRRWMKKRWALSYCCFARRDRQRPSSLPSLLPRVHSSCAICFDRCSLTSTALNGSSPPSALLPLVLFLLLLLLMCAQTACGHNDDCLSWRFHPNTRAEQERADDKVHHAAQLVLDFLWRARFDIPTTISTTVREVTRLADNKGFPSSTPPLKKIGSVDTHLLRPLPTGFGAAGRQIAATLFFLRFVCPALVTVVVPAPLRRVLVQVSKLLQNSASNIRFGDKEKGMARFNGFIDANGERMQQLLDMLYKDVSEGDGARDTTDISGSLQGWKRMSTGKEAAMDKGYVDSLAALRDHLLHNQSFLPRYMKRLDYPQLKVPTLSSST